MQKSRETLFSTLLLRPASGHAAPLIMPSLVTRIGAGRRGLT